jgi:hypothetical protein
MPSLDHPEKNHILRKRLKHRRALSLRIREHPYTRACEFVISWGGMKPNLDDETPRDISGDGESMALIAPPFQIREHPSALASVQNVILGFDRNTIWLATGLLGTVIFAALVLAVQERYPRAAYQAAGTRLAADELFLNADPDALSAKSTGDIASGQATNADRGFAAETNSSNVEANAGSRSPVPQQDPARVIQPKVSNPRYRSSMRTRLAGVKMRLIALWHQSLARNEKSRSWFSNANKAERKKVSFTAEASH